MGFTSLHEEMMMQGLLKNLLGGLGPEIEELREQIGKAGLKSPDLIFAESEIFGLKRNIERLKGALNTFSREIKKRDKKIEAAEKDGADLQRILDNKSYECTRLQTLVRRHENHMQAQAEANKERRHELAVLKDKVSKIEACLNGGLPKKPLARDMKETLGAIIDIIQAPPVSVSEETEA